MTRQDMSETDRSFIGQALRTAADSYKKIADDTRKTAGNNAGLKSLADQFEAQRAQALTLAEVIEEADRIIVEVA